MERKPINWTLLLAVLIVTGGVVIWLLKKDAPKEGTVTTVTETVDVKKLVTEAVNNALANQVPAKQYFEFKIDPNTGKQTVVNVQPGTEGAKELNVYKDTTKVDGGVIYSEIASDGKVYQNKIRAEIEQKTITKTITEKTVLKQSGLFIMGGAYVNPDMKLNTLQGGLHYIHKDGIGVGANIIYDTGTKQPYYGISLSKKIF